jgi:hypothetical protein
MRHDFSLSVLAFVGCIGCAPDETVPKCRPAADAGPGQPTSDGGVVLNVHGMIEGKPFTAVDEIVALNGPRGCNEHVGADCIASVAVSFSDQLPCETANGTNIMIEVDEVGSDPNALVLPGTFPIGGECADSTGNSEGASATLIIDPGHQERATAGWISFSSVNPVVAGSFDVKFGDGFVSGDFQARSTCTSQ